MKWLNQYVFHVLLVSSSLVWIGCSDPEEPAPELPFFQEQVIDYFKEIALGFENGGASEVTRKWAGPMKLYVGGPGKNDFTIATIEETIATLNALATDGFEIQWVSDSSQSNAYVFLGSKEQFIQIFPDAANSLVGNLAYFNVWWNNDLINTARIFIETQSSSLTQQRSLIFEEITQSLGLGKDSPRYPDSIFYEIPSDGGFAQGLSELDKELVRLLYHPSMSVGLSATEVEKLLREILAAELTNV